MTTSSSGGARRMVLTTVAWLIAASASAGVDDSRSLRTLFPDPPRGYSSGPLWVWNDRLTEEQIRSTLRDLAGEEVKQVWVHPRPGLMTPYLSDEWFALWRIALDEAERLDMNVWIYDENSYPSGFAGGFVPEALPDSRGRGLHFREVEQPGKIDRDVVAVFQIEGSGYTDVTRSARQGVALPKGKYLVATERQAGGGGWFGGWWYVDLLKPGVTEKFIEVTFEAYKRELGDHFGKRIPGIFTDEPHLCPAGGLHVTTPVLEEFEKRLGYDLREHLPALVRPLGEWKRVRFDYYRLLLELFIERWGKPCYEWCAKNELEFTGHYWEHGWPGASHGPDNMAMYAWHQRPAIDNLMNDYTEGVHGQFGNSRTVRELASVANQLGRQRTLCETYGAGGWDLRFEDMKRIGDWLYVLGVNTLNEHLSYVTIRGARKRDHPQSFSYHTTWWDDYDLSASYFRRLSLAISAGRQVNRILVLEPTTTGWLYQADPSHRGHLETIGETFQRLIVDLEAAQVEYDLGSEDIIGRHGATEGPRFIVGTRSYEVVVLPPLVETLGKSTVALLEAFAKAGGRVVSAGEAPPLVDGRPSDRVTTLAELPNWTHVKPDELSATLHRAIADGLRIRRAPDDPGNLFHQRRRLSDGELLFLVNTSIDHASRGSITSPMKGVERWDPQSGEIEPYPFESTGDGVALAYDIPPCGSLLVFLSMAPAQPRAAGPPAARARIRPLGPVEAKRTEPNVLTIDYVDVRAGDQERKGIHFYKANQLVWRAHGLGGNPWDSAVQFRDRSITKEFPPASGFQATYRFRIDGAVPRPLHIVIERADLYAVTCNGKSVAAKPGEWWLDRSFGKIDISAAAQKGENEVTVKTRPMTIYHELEPAYVIGDFALMPISNGFAIAPPTPLRITSRSGHSAAIEGVAWLSAGIGWERDPGAEEGNDRSPFVVFDLGGERELRGIEVWNYNERGLTTRGVRRLRIRCSASGEPDSFDREIGTFELRQASGADGESSQMFGVSEIRARFVRLDVLENWSGVKYPARDGSRDAAFAGLAEVRFIGSDASGGVIGLIRDVEIHSVSSELATGTFDRRAVHLVDRSGIGQAGLGWDQQGCPLYGGTVAYTQRFRVDEPGGRYFVRLGAWRGSLARVLVGGELIGRIGWRPWEVEVTDAIRAGVNVVQVEVVGTPKNTLGPHHAGAMRGRAWPSAFRQGPETGPPPGNRYDTIGYGLFEPAVLEVTEEPGGIGTPSAR